MELKQEQAERNRLQGEVEYLEEVVADLQPKISYLEKILNSHYCMTVTEIAADYGISARRLNAILHQERVQRKVGNQWVLYVAFMNCGLTKHPRVPSLAPQFTSSETSLWCDEQRTMVKTKWTQKGRLLIHEILVERGYLPR